MNNFEIAKEYFLDGCAFLEAEDYSKAEHKFRKSLELMPDRPSTLTNLSVAQLKLKKYSEARATAQKAISVESNNSEAYLNLGLLEKELKSFDAAVNFFNKAIILKPSYHEAYSNKGNALNELKRFDEAIAHFDKALSLRPDYHEAWSNKGVTLHELKRFDEAIAHYDKALSLRPDYHEAWSNKGVTLHELKRFDEAIAHYDKALSLRPDYHEASWNTSLSLLLQGDFENGLPLYESRWDSDKVSEIVGKRFFREPTWLGKESLQGKTILLYGEQGLGDFIQFCRYVKLVSDLGAKVILEVPEMLASLMGGLEGLSQLVIKGKNLPFFDCQCPLVSLPLALNTRISSIPASIPYIPVHPNKVSEWGRKLGGKRKKRIGLVWSSMSNFKADSKRSLRLADFIKALPLEGFEYICLQKELKDCDREFFANYKSIRFFGDDLGDFSDTAALIKNVDLVISSCTSIPHLSGALGKETWILLSHVPDWRWLLNREDSPWYPSMKLYRQPSIGDWGSVLDKVKKDLTGSMDCQYVHRILPSCF